MRIRIMCAITALMVAATGCALLTPSDKGGALPKSAKPRAGGRITLAAIEPKSIDPHRVADRQGVFVIKQICDPLVSAHPFTGRLGPGAAESWTYSADAKKLAFKLRPGVKFHNGREVEAQDYVYSLNRLAANKEVGSKAFLLEKIAGYLDLREGRASALSGVKAPDAKTLEIELIEPYADLPGVMSHPSAGSAVPKEEVDKGPDAFATRPICTGPYALGGAWERGKDMVLTRFGGYHGGNDAYSNKGRGYAKDFVIRPVANIDEGYKKFLAREVNLAEVPLGSLTDARKVRNRVESAPNGILAFIGFPVTKPPFDKKEFRQALAKAVDRKQIIEKLLSGTRAIPEGFLPPTAGPSSSSDCPELSPRSRVESAKAALIASGVDPLQTKLVIYLNSGGGHESWLEAVSRQWKTNLGMDSNLRPNEWLKYMDFLAEGGADGPFRLAWPVEFASAESLYGPLFAAKSLDNYMRFDNPEFEEAIKKARSTADDGARVKAYADAGQVLCREMPIIPMWYGESHFAFGPTLAAAAEKRLDLFGDPVLREIGVRS